MLYEQLSGLCRDAAWLKSYIAASEVITKEAMQIATVGLGPSKQPLPSFGLERSLVDEHGAMHSFINFSKLYECIHLVLPIFHTITCFHLLIIKDKVMHL